MQCFVWTDLGGAQRRAGLTIVDRNAGEFNYADGYIDQSGASLDPINLPAVKGGTFRTIANKGIFGVLHDAGPDTWGRQVLKAMDPKWFGTASELDVLMRASGYGVGALLFSHSREGVKGRSDGIRRKDLNAVAEGAQEVEQGEVLRAQLRALMLPSTAMGGVHPKVALTDDHGKKWIAKFASRTDTIDTPRVEFASMRLAAACGLRVARVELTATGERPALLVRRFDCDRGKPLHYASAHALWNPTAAREADLLGWASYAGLVELRRQLPGGSVPEDAEEIFRRMVFNVVIGNTDDHGRNHGFLMDARGSWALAPAFDVLPSLRSEVHAIGIGPDGPARDLQNALAGAARFGLNQAEARQIIGTIQRRVSRGFRDLLTQARCSKADLEAVMARILHRAGR